MSRELTDLRSWAASQVSGYKTEAGALSVEDTKAGALLRIADSTSLLERHLARIANAISAYVFGCGVLTGLLVWSILQGVSR